MAGKIERAYTPKDIKALDCALINGLETKITSVEKGEIYYPNKIPDDAKYSDYYGKRMELETLIIKSSKQLIIVEKVENAKENDDQKMLDNIFWDHVEAISKATFLGD